LAAAAQEGRQRLIGREAAGKFRWCVLYRILRLTVRRPMTVLSVQSPPLHFHSADLSDRLGTRCQCIYVEVSNDSHPNSGCVEYRAKSCTVCQARAALMRVDNRARVAFDQYAPRYQRMH
jgi:hypothetical protein